MHKCAFLVLEFINIKKTHWITIIIKWANNISNKFAFVIFVYHLYGGNSFAAIIKSIQIMVRIIILNILHTLKFFKTQ